MQNYSEGVLPDWMPEQRNLDNPSFALQKLNQLTNGANNSAGEICALDRWVFHVSECSETESVYAASTPENGVKFTTAEGVILCISFNEKFADANDHSWSLS